jgi:hypothetical protein
MNRMNRNYLKESEYMWMGKGIPGLKKNQIVVLDVHGNIARIDGENVVEEYEKHLPVEFAGERLPDGIHSLPYIGLSFANTEKIPEELHVENPEANRVAEMPVYLTPANRDVVEMLVERPYFGAEGGRPLFWRMNKE